MAEESAAKLYSLKDIATHNTNKSCFLVIHNNVYDVTEFLNEVCMYNSDEINSDILHSPPDSNIKWNNINLKCAHTHLLLSSKFKFCTN